MKKKLLIVSIILISLVSIIYVFQENTEEPTQHSRQLAEFLAQHPFSNREILSPEQLKAVPKRDRPDLAFEQDFLRTLDPATGDVPRERLIEPIQMIQEAASNRTIDFNWETRGPLDVSGRTRGIMFDPNDSENKKVFAGGVSGGIWMNSDITDETVSWIQVESGLPNFAISAIDYDPVVTTTFYAGTGEGWNNIDAVRGIGIYKSDDGGNTWSLLSSTSTFQFVYDIVVRDEGGSVGVIYAAARIGNNTDTFRSEDGGLTWATVTTLPHRDLELGPDNAIWAGGANGDVFRSIDGLTWSEVYSSSNSRVELGIAPSNGDVVYALIEGGNALAEIVKTTDSGVNWTNLSEPADVNDSTVPNSDFTRGQAWYDLIVTVNPSDEDEAHIGGINTFRTTDGGTTWDKTSSWAGGVDNSVSFVHADIHNIIFRPENNSILYATDGGIYYAPDASAIPTSGPEAFTTGIFPRNRNYNVTQFYSAAIDPVNLNGFLGGTQDNGSPYFNSPGIDDTDDFSGGDGGFAFIDQTAILSGGTDGSYYIVSNTNNRYRLQDFNDNRFNISIVNSNTGSFINPADYDDVNNTLYSWNGGSSIFRAILNPDNTSQSDASGNFTGNRSSININGLGGGSVTHIRVSPYNESNRAIFVGTAAGVVVRRNNDGTGSIINNGIVAGAVSCVEVGASDDELLVTYSNFGVTSVLYTADGGTTWEDKEGDLPDMPVRWALFNPLDRREVILATEAGIWRTSNITADSPSWNPVSTGMGAVRVDMLQYRESDNLILAGTHGRGMFTSVFTADVASVEDVLTDKKAFSVYPTISSGDFTVFAKNELGDSQILIFDINGKQVYKSKLNFNEGQNQNVSVNLRSGIYIVNIIDQNNRTSSEKIIIR
jgi:hypothetical protein